MANSDVVWWLVFIHPLDDAQQILGCGLVRATRAASRDVDELAWRVGFLHRAGTYATAQIVRVAGDPDPAFVNRLITDLPGRIALYSHLVEIGMLE